MKHSRLKTLAYLMATLASAPSFSAIQWCGGTIQDAWVHANGELYVLPSWRGDQIRLCSITNTLTDSGSSVSPTVCLGWFSTIRTAMVNAKSTIINYSEAPACNAMPTYSSAPLPTYVMLVN